MTTSVKCQANNKLVDNLTYLTNSDKSV